MCIICASEVGMRQPTEAEIRYMWRTNPDGAGYMFINESGRVEIHKGFMDLEEYIVAIRNRHFRSSDPVVYHFRIATQGFNPYMTHPFPLTDDLRYTSKLDLECSCGIAHNGIIRLTSDGDEEYSDTALYITKVLSKLIKNRDDLKNNVLKDYIANETNSRFAIMDKTGYISYIGHWVKDRGLKFSNYGIYNMHEMEDFKI